MILKDLNIEREKVLARMGEFVDPDNEDKEISASEEQKRQGHF